MRFAAITAETTDWWCRCDLWSPRADPMVGTAVVINSIY
jgi:hypothetical protein